MQGLDGPYVPLDASAVNAKGGEGVVKLVQQMIMAMQKQKEKYHSTCTLMVYEGNDKVPRKRGKSKRHDAQIRKALERICNVMHEAVDPQRKFNGNLLEIEGPEFYDLIEISDGIKPSEKDVHCYRVTWRRELGWHLKKRIREETENEIEPGSVFATWRPKETATIDSAENN